MNITDNNIVIICIICLYMLLIFPISINGYFYFSSKDKRAYFLFDIFSVIKVKNGYITLDKSGIIMHLSKVKAVIIPYKNIIVVNKKVKPYLDLNIMDLYINIDLGSQESSANAFFTSSVLCQLFSGLKTHLGIKKPYLKYSPNVNYYLDKDIFNIYAKIKAYINIIIIIISLIKIVLGKIVYEFRKRKQNKYCS